MAFEIEDGSGKSNANAFISVADCDSYHALRGNTNWATLTTAEKEQAIVRAVDFMQQVYAWKGSAKTDTQSLAWPRNYVERTNGYYPNDAIPNEVKNACAELAFKAAGGDLAPDIAQRVIREKIGSLEVEYAQNGVQYTTYRAINNMLAPFLNGLGGAFRKVVRT